MKLIVVGNLDFLTARTAQTIGDFPVKKIPAFH